MPPLYPEGQQTPSSPKAYYGDTCNEKASTAQTLGGSRPSTLREQAESNVGYHRSQADKHDRAAAFFRENPAFDEFIQLIRSGAIQI